MKNLLCLLLMVFGLVAAQAAPLKVASLHPLLSEMATSIGGKDVKVVNLFPENGELHAFAPGSGELSAAAGARLMLACGKGVEPYLADLRESLPSKTKVLELGKGIPDVMVPGSDIPDPHWWNNPDNMKRASRALLSELAAIDPAHAERYAANQKKYAGKMDELMRIGKLKLSRIPQEHRVLVTGHAAMCHFCEAFHFTPIAIQGIARESEGDPARLASLLADLRQKQVRCIFTEANDSPRMLQTIAEQLGVPARKLVMDGIYPSMRQYELLFLYNVGIIAASLK